jgi:cytochrome c-type biogenesis protein CcsB
MFFKITLGLYFLATLAYLICLYKQKPILTRMAPSLLAAGFLTHSLELFSQYLALGHAPVTNLPQSLSFLSWTLIAVYLLLQLRYQVIVLGSFLTPLALISILIAAALPGSKEPLDPILKSYWFPIHITLAFLGDGFFGLAFCSGIMYLLQEHQVKGKKMGFFYHRLPSLRVLDEMNYRCLTLGFPLLTLGIISGSVWAEYAWGSYWHWDPKETWSLITWLVYAALLHGRLTFGWRGRRAAVMSILGFTVLLFTFVGVNLLLKGAHNFI